MTSYNGILTQRYSLSKTIDGLSKQASVHRIQLHVFLLIRMGENPLIIKERLGYEDIETTLGTYGYLYSNSNFEVVSKLQGIMHLNMQTRIPPLKRIFILHDI